MKKILNVSFLTFGGREIGTGHLFRCLAISQWLNIVGKDLEINILFFLYGCDSKSIKVSRNIISSLSNYKVNILSHTTPINKYKWDLVIVDLLNTPFQIMSDLRKVSKMIVSIDNTADSRKLSDIAINPLYYNIDNSFNHNNSTLKHDFIGPEYQIISPKYRNTKRIWRSEVKDILIIQGGSDPNNTTQKIYNEIERVLEENDSVRLHIVTGPAAYKANVKKTKNDSNRIFTYHKVKNMKSLLLNMDLAISSVGIVAFEIASLGIPAIHVTSITKEIETARSLESLGVSLFLGMYNQIEPGEIYNKMNILISNKELRRNMRNSALNFFSNKNTEKLIKLIIKSYG